MSNSNYLADLINKVDFIPPLTKANIELFNLVNGNLNLKRLASIINQDYSLAARIIALANSPIYGLSNKISTIEMAISVLGVETVKDLVMGFSLINSTSIEEDRYFLSDEFNNHSYICGYISQLLANDFDYPVKSEAFVAGLLHDIGIPIIHKFLIKEFRLVSELKFYRRISQTKAESLILGKTHCEIGAMVASKWYFPDTLVDAILNHHTPEKSELNQKLTAIVHLADFIATKEAPQFLLSSEDEQLDERIIMTLNIPDIAYLYDVVNNVSEIVRSINLFDKQ